MGRAVRSRWRIVVPVKPADAAKSRLVAPPGVDHEALARALAMDTIEAVLGLGAARCLVVTADAELAAWVTSQGADVLPDPGAGLDGAIRAGLVSGTPEAPPAGTGRPDAARPATATPEAPPAGTSGGPAAVLLGDLPAVRTADLAAALAACAEVGVGFVPDHLGSGTVLLAALDARDLHPSFGPGSATRHARHAVAVGSHLHRLRRDVDTHDDLAAAADLGLGRFTRHVLGGHASGAVHTGTAPQGTSGECAHSGVQDHPGAECQADFG